MRILTKDGYLDGVGLLFELTDEQLKRVRMNPAYYTDPSFVNECYAAKGSNAHLFNLSVDSRFMDKVKAYQEIYKKFKQLLKEYKTVSWWDKKEETFKITRRKKCLQ